MKLVERLARLDEASKIIIESSVLCVHLFNLAILINNIMFQFQYLRKGLFDIIFHDLKLTTGGYWEIGSIITILAKQWRCSRKSHTAHISLFHCPCDGRKSSNYDSVIKRCCAHYCRAGGTTCHSDRMPLSFTYALQSAILLLSTILAQRCIDDGCVCPHIVHCK